MVTATVELGDAYWRRREKPLAASCGRPTKQSLLCRIERADRVGRVQLLHIRHAPERTPTTSVGWYRGRQGDRFPAAGKPARSSRGARACSISGHATACEYARAGFSRLSTISGPLEPDETGGSARGPSPLPLWSFPSQQVQHRATACQGLSHG